MPPKSTFLCPTNRRLRSIIFTLVLILAVVAGPDFAFAEETNPGAGAGINAQDEIYSASKGDSKNTRPSTTPSKKSTRSEPQPRKGFAKKASDQRLIKKKSQGLKFKVSYETMCEMLNAGRGNCITFDESACPAGDPLITRSITTADGDLVSKDSYCTREPEPELPVGSTYDSGTIRAAIQAAIQEQRVVEVTPDRFQSFPIRASKVASQPNGFSLRNGHAHMYAIQNPQSFNVEIFDEPVRVRAIPQSYLWNYGDGHSRRLQRPGKPMPEHTFDQPTDTSHVYTRTGDFSIRLTTAYRGEYSVAGGPWMPIPGTANVPSDPMPMSVWRTKKLLVEQDCADNPGGPACDSPFLREKPPTK